MLLYQGSGSMLLYQGSGSMLLYQGSGSMLPYQGSGSMLLYQGSGSMLLVHVAVPRLWVHVTVPRLWLHVAVPRLWVHVALPRLWVHVAVPRLWVHVTVPRLWVHVAGPCCCTKALGPCCVCQTDIVKHVVKEYRNIYPEIIKRVGRVFETVFGLKLVEIDSKNHVYILINKLEQLEGESLNMSPSNPKTGLLFVILSIVFMKGGVVKESIVWNTLKKLRVDQGERHEIFGDVKKVVTDEFVRQRYLEYVRIPHTEPLEFEFRWGQRADMEVSKVKLLEFIGQLHEQDPQSWTQQYRDATAPPAAPAVVTSANTSASVSQR
ncbi:necdin-like 2 isoform X1 [Salmo trutta]|nr:non-structural maintenance of chromosomes element 3 homolog isoform X1 [Salmo trutta]